MNSNQLQPIAEHYNLRTGPTLRPRAAVADPNGNAAIVGDGDASGPSVPRVPRSRSSSRPSLSSGQLGLRAASISSSISPIGNPSMVPSSVSSRTPFGPSSSSSSSASGGGGSAYDGGASIVGPSPSPNQNGVSNSISDARADSRGAGAMSISLFNDGARDQSINRSARSQSSNQVRSAADGMNINAGSSVGYVRVGEISPPIGVFIDDGQMLGAASSSGTVTPSPHANRRSAPGVARRNNAAAGVHRRQRSPQRVLEHYIRSFNNNDINVKVK